MRVAKIVVVAIVISVGALSSHVLSNDPEDAKSAKKPLIVFDGANSNISKPRLERIADTKHLQRVWAEHLGTSVEDAYRPELDVDFDRCIVVGIFPGSGTNVCGARIVSTASNAEAIRIRFKLLTFQTAGDNNKRESFNPYLFVVLTKSELEIVAEQDVQRQIGSPPEWQEFPRPTIKN